MPSNLRSCSAQDQKPAEKTYGDQPKTKVTMHEQHGICRRPNCGMVLAVTFSVFYAHYLSHQKEFYKISISLVGDSKENECTVWIAPSSLKGVNGYGVFTTRDICQGESVLGTPDGTGIIVGHYRYGEETKARERELWRDLFDKYWWGRGVPDHVAYETTPDVVDFQIGFGCLPNHHCILDLLTAKYPDPAYDDTLASRFTDPSAGAFSYNRGREFFVSHDMPAGSEFFLNYGWCDRNMSGSPDWVQHAFVESDFQQAANAAETFKKKGEGIDYDAKGDLIVPTGMSHLVADLIPKNRTEFNKLTAGISEYNELVRQIALSSLNRRDPKWIKANGMCMDNLIGKKSTLPLVGQGGFAQRTIRKGDIVAPAFLIQIIDKDVLTPSSYDENGEPAGIQLLMNYCFGHKESSMLLCPNTNAVLINHCSSRTKECGTKGPNAEVQWASGWDPISDDWIKMSISEIAKQPGRGLSLEVVALREIRPGEEVFFDYGEEWENAWGGHVASWKPPTIPEDPWITAKEANDEGPIPDTFISKDLRGIVEHSHLFTGCQYWETEIDTNPIYQAEPYSWEEMSDDEILTEFSNTYDFFRWDEDEDDCVPAYAEHEDRSHWPCTIIWQEEEDTYTVRIHPRDEDLSGLPWAENKFPRLIEGFPRSSIHYFVQRHKSDQYLPGVFRHPIGIRDDIFPPQWKNLKKD